MGAVDIETALDWRGRAVVDRAGERLGKLKEIYLDQDEQPAWGSVHTGLFGLRQTLVPLSEATLDGDRLRLPFEADHVKAAPNVDPDVQVSADEEDALYRHYGMGGESAAAEDDDTAEQHDDTAAGDPGAATDASRADAADSDATGADSDATGADSDATGADSDATGADSGAAAGGSGAAGDSGPAAGSSGAVAASAAESQPPAAGRATDGSQSPTAASETDDAMTRSEEEVRIGKRVRETGRVRLKKYVVTDYVEQRIPVSREEVRIEREPPVTGGDE